MEKLELLISITAMIPLLYNCIARITGTIMFILMLKVPSHVGSMLIIIYWLKLLEIL